jgi:hypothetical protein
MTRAEEAARMQLEQHINRLKDAVEGGNKKGAHGGRVFDPRLAITDVEKGRFICSNYGIDSTRLEEAAEAVWKALMQREEYEQAEWFASSIGI